MRLTFWYQATSLLSSSKFLKVSHGILCIMKSGHLAWHHGAGGGGGGGGASQPN